MDYEKAYKEALERAKYIYNTPCKPAEAATIKETLTSIFPFLADELAESEDEKTRKEIVGYLKRNLRFEWATWLEKQGESYTKKDVDNAYIEGMAFAKDELDKQSDSPIKWNKNTKDCKPKVSHSVLMKTTHGIAEGEWQGEYWHQYRWSGVIKDSDVLSWMELSDLEKQSEQASAWSEEDEQVKERLIRLCTQYMIPDGVAITCENWLKSIKQRIGGKL